MTDWKNEQINRIFNQPKNKITKEYISRTAYLVSRVNKYHKFFIDAGITGDDLPQIIISPIRCRKCYLIMNHTALFAPKDIIENSICHVCDRNDLHS